MEEDLAASLTSHSHSAPLYLLYDVARLTKHGLAPPPAHYVDDDDGFEFFTATKDGGGQGGGDAKLRACASDVSAAAFADELFRAGVLLPLRLPPRLQRPARSAGASAATSPVCRAAKHGGFDPFTAALEKVREDGGGAAPRRSRSLSLLRRSAAAAVQSTTKDSKPRAPRPTAAQKAVAARPTTKWPARKGVKQLLSRAVMVSARPRRTKDGVSYHRPGLLGCFGF
jgi:hypothetical protein